MLNKYLYYYYYLVSHKAMRRRHQVERGDKIHVSVPSPIKTGVYPSLQRGGGGGGGKVVILICSGG